MDSLVRRIAWHKTAKPNGGQTVRASVVSKSVEKNQHE